MKRSSPSDIDEKTGLPAQKLAKQSSLHQFFKLKQEPAPVLDRVPSLASNSDNEASQTIINSQAKKASNPFSTGGGGFQFEQKVQANFVALFLMGGIFPITGRDDCYKISVQSRRQGNQTDDVVMHFKGQDQQDYRLLAQIKHKLTFSDSDEQTKDSLEQAWADFQNAARFDRERDRIVFITGTLPQKLIDHLKPLFDWARCSEDENDFMARFNSNAKEKKKRLESIRTIIKKQAKTDISDLELWEFIKVLDVLDYDFDLANGKDMTSILNQIKANLIDQSEENTSRVWGRICSEVSRFNVQSGVFTKKNITKDLLASFYKKSTSASLWHVPHFDAQNFVGNQEYLDDIEQRFANKKGESVMVPIFGLGGVGKTYLALKSVVTLSKNYDLVAWFNASNKESLEVQFLDFSRANAIYFEESSNTESKIEKIKDWFVKNPNSLLIFDNAESYVFLKPFIPSKVHVLITSLNSKDWNLGIPIDPMKENDAIKVLKLEANIDSSDDRQNENIRKLVNFIGMLPLAVAQAGAYIGAVDISVEEYIDHYESEKRRMLDDGTLQAKRGEHISVYITFNISISKVKDSFPKAKDLLDYCAYLSTNSIPRKLLLSCQDDPNDRISFNEQIATLKKYSLVKSDATFVYIHCVVQDVLREKNNFEGLNIGWVFKILVLLNTNFRYSRNTRSALNEAKLLIPHMIRAKELAMASLVQGAYQTELGELLYKIGVFYLDYLYDSMEAKNQLKLAGTFIKDPDLLKRNSKYLLKAYSKNKEFNEAQQLAKHFDCHTEEDVDILCVLGNHYLRNNSDQNRFENAKAYFDRAHMLAKRNGDEEKIAMCCHYLGTFYRYKGDKQQKVANLAEQKGWRQDWQEERMRESNEFVRESISYYKKALAIKKNIYELNHIEVARTELQLGTVLLKASDFRNAKQHIQNALNSLLEFYGDELREDIADALYHLATACIKLGEVQNANTYFAKCLEHLTSNREKHSDKIVKVQKEMDEVTSLQRNSILRFLPAAAPSYKSQESACIEQESLSQATRPKPNI